MAPEARARICEVDGCEKRSDPRRRICYMHTYRWRKWQSYDLPGGTQSPTGRGADNSVEEGEEWRTIPGYEGYEASNLGRIRSWRKPYALPEHGRPYYFKLSPTPGNGPGHGYVFINLTRDGRKIAWSAHRLVAFTFLGPCPEGMQVRHLDGSRSNNRVDNLCYGTALENAQDKERHGTIPTPPPFCPKGHPMTGENVKWLRTRGHRYCRTCSNEKSRAYYRRSIGRVERGA